MAEREFNKIVLRSQHQFVKVRAVLIVDGVLHDLLELLFVEVIENELVFGGRLHRASAAEYRLGSSDSENVEIMHKFNHKLKLKLMCCNFVQLNVQSGLNVSRHEEVQGGGRYGEGESAHPGNANATWADSSVTECLLKMSQCTSGMQV